MKLATYRDGSRDGQLVVVSRDLSQACFATGIATRLQQVLDDWNFMAPQLEALSQSLNQGRARHAFSFDPRQCLAPLPRPAAWLAGEAYPAHGAELRERDIPVPERLSGPLIRMGGAETLLGPNDTPLLRGVPGLEPEPQLAVVLGDLPADAVPSQALDAVRLLMGVNAWVLRPVQQEELAQGWPALHSRPALQCAPVAITPDELPGAWYLGRAALQIQMHRNGRKQPLLDAKEGMAWSFGDLIAEAARRRPLRAGTLVGAGMPAGAAVMALKDGDSLRIDFKAADGGSPFGAIDMDLAESVLAAEDEGADDAADVGDGPNVLDDARDARDERDADERDATDREGHEREASQNEASEREANEGEANEGETNEGVTDASEVVAPDADARGVNQSDAVAVDSIALDSAHKAAARPSRRKAGKPPAPEGDQ